MVKEHEEKEQQCEVATCTLSPKFSNYDEFKKKCEELVSKWQEIENLVAEVQNMEVSIEFYQSQ